MDALSAAIAAAESAPAPTEVETPKEEVVETETEVEDEVGHAEPEAKAEPKKVQKYKLTLGGETIEATDADIERMWKAAQEGSTAKEKAKLMEQEVQAFFERAKDPDYYFKHMGIDVDDYVERRVLSKLEEAQLTPEQKKLRDLELKLKQYEEQEAKVKAEEESKKTAALEAEAANAVDTIISEVLSSSGKKPTPRHIARVAEHLLAELDANPEASINSELATKAFKRFQSELRGEISSIAAELSDEELVDMLGNERFNSLLKYSAQSAKRNVPNFAPKNVVAKDEASAGKQSKQITWDEFIASKLKD